MRHGQMKPRLNVKAKNPTANSHGMKTGSAETSVMFMAAFDHAGWRRYMRKYFTGRV